MAPQIDIMAWANAATADRRNNPNAPRPQLEIPAAVAVDFGGWRLLPRPTSGDEFVTGETPTWSLERPFAFEQQRLVVRYSSESAFLADESRFGGWMCRLVVTVSDANDGGPILEFVSSHRLETHAAAPERAERVGEMARLLAAIKDQMPELTKLWENANSHWGYEDMVYRFYHQSFKVYRVQQTTLDIYWALQSLMPERWLNLAFVWIVRAGTGNVFAYSHNSHWAKHTRPQLEAFFHARHVLEMVLKYGHELDEPPNILPSGWATLLCIFGLR